MTMIPIHILAETPEAITNVVEGFGLHAGYFVAHLIAFIIVVALLRVFAFKPIQNILEERKRRIAEGERMRADSEQKLAEARQTGEILIEEAREEGRLYMERTRKTAEKVLAEKTEEAEEAARGILEKSREAAELDARREREALKSEFARMLALATERVTGRILTEEDHRRINEEAISHL